MLSVDSKEVVASKMVQNTVCFVSVADRGLRPKNRLPESKNASKDAGVLGLKTHYYPANTIRREKLFVKGKVKKPGVGRRRKSKAPAFKSEGCRARSLCRR